MKTIYIQAFYMFFEFLHKPVKKIFCLVGIKKISRNCEFSECGITCLFFKLKLLCAKITKYISRVYYILLF